jgi:HSP20 family protein
MALTHWPYFRGEFWPEELLKAFSPFEGAGKARLSGVFPAINIYDDGESFLVRAEMPGVNKDSLEITAKGDQLTIRGERKIEGAHAQANYHRREREGGQFRKVVTLPQPVDGERISATYKEGVLEVVLARTAETQPRKIAIH